MEREERSRNFYSTLILRMKSFMTDVSSKFYWFFDCLFATYKIIFPKASLSEKREFGSMMGWFSTESKLSLFPLPYFRELRLSLSHILQNQVACTIWDDIVIH